MPLAAIPRHAARPARRPARTLLSAVILVVVFAAGTGLGRWLEGADGTVGASSSLADRPEFAILQTTWDLIHDEWAVPDEVDEQALFYGAATGMIDALGDDGHSRFLDPADALLFEESSRGEFTGIGVEIDFRTGLPVVVAPIDDSPAFDAGILAGDTILEVDGSPTERLSQEEVGDRIRGDAGTDVVLSLAHRGNPAPYRVNLTRRVIVLDPVSWRMLPGQIAHLRLSSFSIGATRDLKVALDEIVAAGASGIVLDLRDNPGGLVSEAIGVASQFMVEGTTVFRQQDTAGALTPFNTVGLDGRWLDQPLVVLVNRGSASAAEIVGAALRDNDRAALLGETTFGTGTVLLPFPQPDGSVVLLGTALWLTAEGGQIWKEGVVPDQEILLPFDAAPSRPSEDANVTPAEFSATLDVQLRSAVARLADPSDIATNPGGESQCCHPAPAPQIR